MEEVDLFKKELCGFRWLMGESKTLDWYWYYDFNKLYPYIFNLKKEKDKYLLKIIIIDFMEFEVENVSDINGTLVGYGLDWMSLPFQEQLQIILKSNTCLLVEKVIRDKTLHNIIKNL